MSVLSLIEAQLAAYNAQDLDAHCAAFAEDIIVADVGGDVRISGLEAYRATYAKVFAEFPENKAELLQRIVLGNKVVDHERVRRTSTAEPFDVVAIYTVGDGKISRVDFVR